MRDNSSSRRFQLLSSFGRVLGTTTSIAFQCWWSSLNHLFFPTFQRVDSAQVLPCILCKFVLQLSSWTRTYPFGLRGDVGTPNPLWVGVEWEKSQWSPSDLGIWNQESHHCTINVHICIMENMSYTLILHCLEFLVVLCVFILPHTLCVCLTIEIKILLHL